MAAKTKAAAKTAAKSAPKSAAKSAGKGASPIVAPAKFAVFEMRLAARRKLENDEARIALTLSVTAKTVKAAQAKLLEEMAAGMKAIRKAANEGAALQTGWLTTMPNRAVKKGSKGAKTESWTARQDLFVTVTGPASLAAAVIEEASDRYEFSGIRFSVSDAAAASARSELMGSVLADLASKAAVIARATGVAPDEVKAESVEFEDELSGDDDVEQELEMPLARMRLSDLDEAPQERPDTILAAGQSTVSLTARARLVIGERPKD